MLEQLAARDALDRLPAAIREVPDLWMGLGLYYQAFWDLDSCRTYGMSEGPIGWLSVDAYATARGFDEEQRADLHHHIAAMDRVYLKHQSDKAEKGRKRADKPQSGKLHAPNPKGGKRR